MTSSEVSWTAGHTITLLFWIYLILLYTRITLSTFISVWRTPEYRTALPITNLYLHSFCEFSISGNKRLTLLPHSSWPFQTTNISLPRWERPAEWKECRNKDYPEVALWLKYTWILITVNELISYPSEERLLAITAFVFL